MYTAFQQPFTGKPASAGCHIDWINFSICC